MRLPSLSLIALSLLSAPSYAVENGTPIDWGQYDDTVRLENPTGGNCTATLIASRYAITAGHCLDDTGIDRLITASDDTVVFTEQWISPEYTDQYGRRAKDVGIVRIDTPVDYHHIQFLNIDEQSEGKPIVIRGFGGTVDTLNQADFTFSNYHWDKKFRVYADIVNESHTTGGDSGAAWTINKDGGEEIFAIHRGSSMNTTTNERSTYGTTIQSVQNFITKTTDGWHYPTLVDTNENDRATIIIQSLHHNEVLGGAWGDNVTITGGTCLDGLIAPFDKCTYDIESDGTQGELYLTDNEVIHINKPTENGGGDGGGDSKPSDGGSMGIWSLLLLGLASFRRWR